MSDALLSAAQHGLESNQPAPALLWLVAHAASGKPVGAIARDIAERLAALLARRGDTCELAVPAGAAWSDLARTSRVPEWLLQALNPAAAALAPVEGSTIRTIHADFQASICVPKRTLRLHWKSELAAEFLLCGFDSIAIPNGPQEIRQKRIDSIYYDPKLSRKPRELHGLRFDRHVLQVSGGWRIHGLPDWDSNTLGLGLAADEAAICFAALPIGSRLEIETEAPPPLASPPVRSMNTTPRIAAPSLSEHIALVHFDPAGWKAVRVTAAGIAPALGHRGAAIGSEAIVAGAAPGGIACGEIEVTPGAAGDHSWTASFTTSDLTALATPIEAAPLPPSEPAPGNSFFPIYEQGDAWPPPTGWQLLQLGLTLTAVVFLGIFAFRAGTDESPLAKSRLTPTTTKPAILPKPIADTAQANAAKGTPATLANSGTPGPLPIPYRPSPAGTPTHPSGNSPRVAPAIFVEKPTGDGLPPVVAPEQANRVVMEVLVPDRAVALGSRAIYEIRLKNQGFLPAEGIDVQALFSEFLQPDAADGMPARHGPGRLVFDRIRSLAPGEELTLRVAAKAEFAGRHRFRPEVMVANPPQRIHSESTTEFYAPVSRNPGMNVQR